MITEGLTSKLAKEAEEYLSNNMLIAFIVIGAVLLLRWKNVSDDSIKNFKKKEVKKEEK